MALCSAAISHVAVGERASNDTSPWLGSTLEKGNTVGGSASSLLPRASRIPIDFQFVARLRSSSDRGRGHRASTLGDEAERGRGRGGGRGHRGAGREGGAAEGRQPWAPWCRSGRGRGGGETAVGDVGLGGRVGRRRGGGEATAAPRGWAGRATGAPVRLRSSGRVWPSAGVDADGKSSVPCSLHEG